MRLTYEIAHSIWRYDPNSGFFFWKISPRNQTKVGDRAGGFNGKYWILQYRGTYYKAARIAWLMQTGDWPKDQIDHKNGIKLDDSFSNLREASNQQNCCNQTVRKNNKLGIKGVSIFEGKYKAQICRSGRVIYLGLYDNVQAAKAAYDAEAAKLHEQFAGS